MSRSFGFPLGMDPGGGLKGPDPKKKFLAGEIFKKKKKKARPPLSLLA